MIQNNNNVALAIPKSLMKITTLGRNSCVSCPGEQAHSHAAGEGQRQEGALVCSRRNRTSEYGDSLINQFQAEEPSKTNHSSPAWLFAAF